MYFKARRKASYLHKRNLARLKPKNLLEIFENHEDERKRKFKFRKRSQYQR